MIITYCDFLVPHEELLICQVANPVPRVVHPDWLHKKVREKEDKFRQRKLIDIFSPQKRDDTVRMNNDPVADKSNDVKDMEDFRNAEKAPLVGPQPIVCTYGVNHKPHQVKTGQPVESSRLHDRIESRHNHLKQLLQNDLEENIDSNEDYLGWLELRKRKWRETREKRKRRRYFSTEFVTSIEAYSCCTGGGQGYYV